MVFVLGYGLSFTSSYLNERAVLLLLLNFTIANIILALMLTNMTKRRFSLLQIHYLYLLVPLIAWHFDLPQQLYVTRGCAVAAFLGFYLQIAVVSKQWLDHSGRSFWVARPKAI